MNAADAHEIVCINDVADFCVLSVGVHEVADGAMSVVAIHEDWNRVWCLTLVKREHASIHVVTEAIDLLLSVVSLVNQSGAAVRFRPTFYGTGFGANQCRQQAGGVLGF